MAGAGLLIRFTCHTARSDGRRRHYRSGKSQRAYHFDHNELINFFKSHGYNMTDGKARDRWLKL
jgi:hypothetical protein